MFKQVSYISVSWNIIKENINISEQEMKKNFWEPIKTEYSSIYWWSFVLKEDELVKYTIYTSDGWKTLNLIWSSTEEDVRSFLDWVKES